VSTNVFRRRGDAWRLWVHHGSPVLAPEEAP
jgi:ketosteroid isomerase-like protein